LLAAAHLFLALLLARLPVFRFDHSSRLPTCSSPSHPFPLLSSVLTVRSVPSPFRSPCLTPAHLIPSFLCTHSFLPLPSPRPVLRSAAARCLHRTSCRFWRHPCMHMCRSPFLASRGSHFCKPAASLSFYFSLPRSFLSLSSLCHFCLCVYLLLVSPVNASYCRLSCVARRSECFRPLFVLFVCSSCFFLVLWHALCKRANHSTVNII